MEAQRGKGAGGRAYAMLCERRRKAILSSPLLLLDSNRQSAGALCV